VCCAIGCTPRQNDQLSGDDVLLGDLAAPNGTISNRTFSNLTAINSTALNETVSNGTASNGTEELHPMELHREGARNAPNR
jgi:hypothetical protein